MRIPRYKEDIPKGYPFLESMPIREVGEIDDQYLLGRSQILTLLKYYEEIYQMPFIMEEDYLPLYRLVPTQPIIDRNRLNSIRRILVPITCISYGDRFYILDGHVRAMAAKSDGYKKTHSIILSSIRKKEYEIVKTAENMGLKNIDNVKIV